jgi:hypothetical protein
LNRSILNEGWGIFKRFLGSAHETYSIVRNAEYNKMWSTTDGRTLDGAFRGFYSAFFSLHASPVR